MLLWTHVGLVLLSFDCLSRSLHPIASPPLSALIFFEPSTAISWASSRSIRAHMVKQGTGGSG
jgi:hypothetical protein